STSRSTRRERVLEVSELGALPRGRALLLASGIPPTLVRTVPWMDGPAAAEVRASIAAHAPAARRPPPAAARPARTVTVAVPVTPSPSAVTRPGGSSS
ncbi:hypothetical protein ACFQL5_19205, partial [Aquipuribacter hungaricus]